jgi:hypothetical protein
LGKAIQQETKRNVTGTDKTHQKVQPFCGNRGDLMITDQSIGYWVCESCKQKPNTFPCIIIAKDETNIRINLECSMSDRNDTQTLFKRITLEEATAILYKLKDAHNPKDPPSQFNRFAEIDVVV